MTNSKNYCTRCFRNHGSEVVHPEIPKYVPPAGVLIGDGVYIDVNSKGWTARSTMKGEVGTGSETELRDAISAYHRSQW